MSQSENTSSVGATPKAPRQRKQSEPKPAPKPEPSPQSSMPHKQGVQPSQAPVTQADKVKAVQSLFRGESQPDDDTASDTINTTSGEEHEPRATPQIDPIDADEGADDQPPAPTSVKDGPLDVKQLAEQLGTTPKKLYENLQIALGDDGEPVTLGQLKDRVKNQETAAREIVEKEQALSVREARMLQDQQQMQTVLEALKGKVDPNLIDQIKQQSDAKVARERQLALRAMPELQDETKFAKFRDDIVELTGEYGFKPQELAITDHRIAVMLRDFVTTKRHLKRLLEFQPQQQPQKAAKPQRPKPKPDKATRAIENARRAGATQADKLGAVSEVLKSRRKRR